MEDKKKDYKAKPRYVYGIFSFNKEKKKSYYILTRTFVKRERAELYVKKNTELFKEKGKTSHFPIVVRIRNTKEELTIKPVKYSYLTTLLEKEKKAWEKEGVINPDRTSVIHKKYKDYTSDLPKKKLPWNIPKGKFEYEPEQIYKLVVEYIQYVRDYNSKAENPILSTRTNFSRWLRDKGIFVTRMTFWKYEQPTNPRSSDWKKIFGMIDEEQSGVLENRAIGGEGGTPQLQMLMLKNKAEYVDRTETVVESSKLNISAELEIPSDLDMEGSQEEE